MTITAKSCAEFLREHNAWRRGGESDMQTPFEIGRHIDFAIGVLEQAVDIDTLEQESRQMRARMERLKKDRDELLVALEYYVDNSSEHDFGGVVVVVVATCESRDRAIKAIASAEEN